MQFIEVQINRINIVGKIAVELILCPARLSTSQCLRLVSLSWGSSRGGSVGGLGSISGLGSIGGLHLQGVAVVDLLADLLGEGQLDSLAVGGSKSGHALVDGLSDGLDLGDGDALVLGQVLTADPGQGDGLVDAGLDGLGVGDGDGGVDHGDDGEVVASLLGDLLAVVVAVSAISAISVVGLADGHHHGLALLLEADLDSLAGGLLVLGLVGVGADLVVDLLDALGTDGPGDVVALLHILDALPAQVHGVAGGVNVRGAHIGGLNNIQDAAVVLGVLVPVVGGGVVVGGSMVGGLVVSWLVVSGLVVSLGGHSRGQSGNQETQPSLEENRWLVWSVKTANMHCQQNPDCAVICFYL